MAKTHFYGGRLTGSGRHVSACGQVELYYLDGVFVEGGRLTAVVDAVDCASCLRTLKATGWEGLRQRLARISPSLLVGRAAGRGNRRIMQVFTRPLTREEAEVFVDAVLEAAELYLERKKGRTE